MSTYEIFSLEYVSEFAKDFRSHHSWKLDTGPKPIFWKTFNSKFKLPFATYL